MPNDIAAHRLAHSDRIVRPAESRAASRRVRPGTFRENRAADLIEPAAVQFMADLIGEVSDLFGADPAKPLGHGCFHPLSVRSPSGATALPPRGSEHGGETYDDDRLCHQGQSLPPAAEVVEEVREEGCVTRPRHLIVLVRASSQNCTSTYCIQKYTAMPDRLLRTRTAVMATPASEHQSRPVTTTGGWSTSS